MGIFKKTGDKLSKEGLRIVGANEVKQGFKVSADVVKDLARYNLKKYVPTSPHFSMDTERYVEVQKSFKKILIMFICLLFFAIMMIVIALLQHNWKWVITSFGFFVLCGSFFFRYHFWLYQMKRKKLGCTFGEWYRDVIQSRFKVPKSAKKVRK